MHHSVFVFVCVYTFQPFCINYQQMIPYFTANTKLAPNNQLSKEIASPILQFNK